ncbi:MAG: cupredoxin family copper-binding protein [Chitinophagales bacterium]
MKKIIQVVNIDKYMTIIKNRMTSALGLSLLFLTILVSCSKSSATNNNSPAAPNSVSIVNMAFAPASINVTPGTTITWSNKDNMTHTVTANDDSFDSGGIGTGGSFTKTFSAAGTYLYHCSIHPSMTGTIIVK